MSRKKNTEVLTFGLNSKLMKKSENFRHFKCVCFFEKLSKNVEKPSQIVTFFNIFGQFPNHTFFFALSSFVKSITRQRLEIHFRLMVLHSCD